MLAGPERRAQLMRETHGERRRWISEDNPTIVDILTKFNVFLRFPEEVSVYKLTTLPYLSIVNVDFSESIPILTPVWI